MAIVKVHMDQVGMALVDTAPVDTALGDIVVTLMY